MINNPSNSIIFFCRDSLTQSKLLSLLQDEHQNHEVFEKFQKIYIQNYMMMTLLSKYMEGNYLNSKKKSYSEIQNLENLNRRTLLILVKIKEL